MLEGEAAIWRAWRQHKGVQMTPSHLVGRGRICGQEAKHGGLRSSVVQGLVCTHLSWMPGEDSTGAGAASVGVTNTSSTHGVARRLEPLQ